MSSGKKCVLLPNQSQKKARSRLGSGFVITIKAQVTRIVGSKACHDHLIGHLVRAGNQHLDPSSPQSIVHRPLKP